MAARQDKSKFNKIKGYRSKGFEANIKILTAIHRTIKRKNEIIKVQLPPNEATLSATL